MAGTSDPGLWDRAAPTWDRRTAGLERRFMAEGRRWVTSRARGRTLDVGIGTGANLPLYRHDVEVTGVDFSAGLLAEARRRADELGRPVRLEQAGADRLPFPDDSFDTVVSTFVMCSVPSLDDALAEMVRVLRPDGQLLLADHVASRVAAVRWVQRLMDLITARQGEYWTRRPLDHLQGAGLRLVETQNHSLGIMEQLSAVPG